jgi:uncharacterized protein (DUF58 family)
MSKSAIGKYLDPKTLDKITRLDLKARMIVEGFVSGMHKSPYHGFSVEFAQHREYVPGDDPRHLDWKVFGRSDRLYLKEYELETNLRSHIILDVSESMQYGSDDLTKFELGCYIAASMAHMIINQQDAIGLATFSKELHSVIPPGSSAGHMGRVLTELVTRKAENTTELGTALHRLAEQFNRRSLVIVISDLFHDTDKTLEGLQHLRHRKHDVIVFHVMDPYEIDFPFQRMTRFEGLEDMPKIVCDPRAIRKAYQEEVNEFLSIIKRGCDQSGIDYAMITTDQQIDVALTTYLATRLGTRTKGK